VPSADNLGKIARLLEDGSLRPDIAGVYSLQNVAQAWKDMAGKLSAIRPEVAALYNPSGTRTRHGKIVLQVA